MRQGARGGHTDLSVRLGVTHSVLLSLTQENKLQGGQEDTLGDLDLLKKDMMMG